MSTTELHDVETLLERALPDPMGFLERVIEQLLERLGNDPALDRAVVTGVDADAHRRLEDHNLLLAAALGACECWGRDPGCRECRGLGASGWLPPDPELFHELVAPALGRMGAGVEDDGTGAEVAAPAAGPEQGGDE